MLDAGMMGDLADVIFVTTPREISSFIGLSGPKSASDAVDGSSTGTQVP
jgi:hypothetical protein